MVFSKPKLSTLLLAASIIVITQPATANIDIVFDYTYDTGFLTGANSSRQSILEAAAAVFESRLQDELTAITSSGSNQATFAFLNPATPIDALPEYVPGASVGHNQIRIYVAGSYSINGGISYVLGAGGLVLGTGIPGGVEATGDSTFVANANSRGQAGALGPATSQTDVGMWGGSISFGLSEHVDWYFDPDPGTTESFTGYDFYSVALHEIGHVLGFGRSHAFTNRISGTQFTGPEVIALTGSAQALNGPSDLRHWAPGAAYNGVLTAMNPVFSTGQRYPFTELDFAALKDIGWQVTAVPEAENYAMFLVGLGLLVWRKKLQQVSR